LGARTKTEGEKMTKKDYILLTNIIKSNSRFADLRGEKTAMLHRSNFMFDLCKMLKNDNSNFMKSNLEKQQAR
jgi:hypothetical protein